MKECVETGHGNRDGCHGSRGISPDAVESFQDRATATASAESVPKFLAASSFLAHKWRLIISSIQGNLEGDRAAYREGSHRRQAVEGWAGNVLQRIEAEVQGQPCPVD